METQHSPNGRAPLEGTLYIKLSTAAKLRDVSLATVWNDIRTDPDHPKLHHDNKGMARLLAHEYTAYLAKKYSHRATNRAQRAREKRAA